MDRLLTAELHERISALVTINLMILNDTEEFCDRDALQFTTDVLGYLECELEKELRRIDKELKRSKKK